MGVEFLSLPLLCVGWRSLVVLSVGTAGTRQNEYHRCSMMMTGGRSAMHDMTKAKNRRDDDDDDDSNVHKTIPTKKRPQNNHGSSVGNQQPPVPLFPPNYSLADNDFHPAVQQEGGDQPWLLTEQEADLWTSSTAAKFAVGRYVPTCRRLGVISRILIATDQFSWPSPKPPMARKKPRLEIPVGPNPSKTTTTKKKKKPPIIPLPTMAQAKRHVILTSPPPGGRVEEENEEEEEKAVVERRARAFHKSWTQIRERGMYEPGWDTSTGELVVVRVGRENTSTSISCLELHRCMTQPRPTLLDDPSTSNTASSDSTHAGGNNNAPILALGTVPVLQALIEVMTPHPSLYDQPLVVPVVHLCPWKENGADFSNSKTCRYQLKIAVYANRLLFECMTQQLQVIMDALDPSSIRVTRPLLVPPSRTLSTSDFVSAEYPKVVIPKTDIDGPEEEEKVNHEEDLDELAVEGSTRCDANTIDAFTIPGLMKLLENTGTFDENIWLDTIAPKLVKSDKMDGGGLELELMLHQKHGVCWMYQMERVGNLNHLIWERRTFCEGDGYFYSPALGQLRLTLADDSPSRLNAMTRGGGGVLCDEMGLGKTVQTLALIVATLDDLKRIARVQNLQRQHCGNWPTFRHATLIVIPPALLAQWISEIAKIAPWLVVDMLLPGVNELGRVQPVGDGYDPTREADIVLATYKTLEDNALLRSKKSTTISLADQKWGRIVLDEMQEIRSWTKQISKLINSLRSDCRWMLSGTPLLENVNDLRGELCFLGLEPFSATNDDGFFHFAVASHWEHKSRYGLSVLKKLGELVMLRRSKTMFVKQTGLPLLGLKPFTLIYEPVPQDDSERAIYCFLEFLMHRTIDIPTVSERPGEDDKHEARRVHERRRNRIAFLRMLREICLSTSLLNGGLGCGSQLDTLNRWMVHLNRRLHHDAIQPEGVPPRREHRESRATVMQTQHDQAMRHRVLSCDEAVRFLSQVEDLARTDQDFVTDVHVGGGGGISNRNRAIETLEERFETEAAEYERSKNLCASASSSRAKAYWHFALEGVTTGQLFVSCQGAYDGVTNSMRRLWRWRSCASTNKMFRGWRPTDNFWGLSLSHGRDEALMSLLQRQPRFYWAHPHSVILDGIPASVTRAEVALSVDACLVAVQTAHPKLSASVFELSNPDTADSWKALVTFSSRDQFVNFLKMARSADGVALKCEYSSQRIKNRIDDAKKKLDECMAVHRVHPTSLTMSDLSKAKKEFRVAKRGLCIFSEEKKTPGHICCLKTLGPLRNATPLTSKALFDTTACEVEETSALLAEHMPLMLRRKKTVEKMKEKVQTGAAGNVCQLTTVEALRTLKDPNTTDQVTCPICYDSLGHDASLVALTRCGHMCCNECMLSWIHEKVQRGQVPSCIECRKPVLGSQLVTVDPKKTDDGDRFVRRREKAKSLVQQAAATLDSNHGQLPPHLWEALYLAIDPPFGESQSFHNTLTAIPPLVLAHIRNATAMTIHCTKSEPRDNAVYRLSSKIRALLADLPRNEVSVVFASSKTCVIHLLTVLEKNGIGCRGLYAGQTELHSKHAVSDWQSLNEVLVLVVQAGVAACGLTLTKASKMFLMEPFLKHEEEKQAYARLHRYGQEREVFCKVYYTPVSVEERLLLWRHRFEHQNVQRDAEETTVFAPIRGVQHEDDKDDSTEEVESQQTAFLLGLTTYRL